MTKHVLMMIVLLITVMGFAVGYIGDSLVAALYIVFVIAFGFYIGMKHANRSVETPFESVKKKQ
jgi:disulfide bond formation protein DsbB